MPAQPADLRRKVDELPERPGIYLMKDARGQVIYVGKAKSLRARVRSYFLRSDDDRLIMQKLDEIADVDVVVAASNKEALILESNFIKQFRPRYNVCLRDDKSFVSIKVPLGEDWPRPVVTRKVGDKRARYFGPFANARAARRTLRVLMDVFPLRKCSLRQCREAKRPCLYGQMGKCLAPCCAEVTKEDYDALVQEVMLFLSGRSEDLIAGLRAKMAAASAAQDYERAGVLRDRVQAVETTLESQVAASTESTVDRDVFGLALIGERIWIAALFVRNGSIQDVATYDFAAELGAPEAVFRAFLNQFYASTRFVPDEVLVPVPDEDADVLAEWLSEKKNRKVRVHWPQRGEKRRLVEMAVENARQAERSATSNAERRAEEMAALRDLLRLPDLPHAIECFDISNLSGRESVGSMVVFRDGAPDKSSYRRFRIRAVAGQDDFAMMAEVLGRRYGHAEAGELPDLIVVDGGKGQLSSAREALKATPAARRDVVALAKARSRGGKKTRVERVFRPGRSEATRLPETNRGTHLITRVRDEAHRFAVDYHRRLRSKAMMRSPLMDVEGVGPALAARLMKRFRRLDRIVIATEDELADVQGVSPRLASAIRAHLNAR